MHQCRARVSKESGYRQDISLGELEHRVPSRYGSTNMTSEEEPANRHHPPGKG